MYIVRCTNNALYTGITKDLKNRLKVHNSGKGSKSVRAHGIPVKLVWTKEYDTKSLALKEEYRIKQLTKLKKEALILT